MYERFFQGYCVKVADTHGIVYTPQPIVDFMCASVAEVLDKEFGLSLSARPACTSSTPAWARATSSSNLMRRIPKKDLPRMYREQLFANEIMLMPYYIAALNIEHAYYELTGEYEPFEGLCFVDTLEMAEHPHGQFAFMTEANTSASSARRDAHHGHHRQSAVQRLAAERERQQQEPEVPGDRQRIKRNLREGFRGHEQERACRICT